MKTRILLWLFIPLAIAILYFLEKSRFRQAISLSLVLTIVYSIRGISGGITFSKLISQATEWEKSLPKRVYSKKQSKDYELRTGNSVEIEIELAEEESKMRKQLIVDAEIANNQTLTSWVVILIISMLATVMWIEA